MLVQYHTEICQRALGDNFSPRALEVIIAANIAQDGLRGQIGHPEFHFDDNAFDASYAYLEEQRLIILKMLARGDDLTPAWEAFGRLTHTAQDFYAHSNYLALWAESHPEGELPPHPQVDALNPELLNHPKLRSGRIYLWDFLTFIPILHGLALHILPPDSHAHTNLDHPERGALFPYAIEAAVKRTIHEYEQLSTRIRQELGVSDLSRFMALKRRAADRSLSFALRHPSVLQPFSLPCV